MNLIELMKIVKDGDKVKIKGKRIDREVICEQGDEYTYLRHNGKFISDAYSLQVLANADYEIMEEKKYYLVLDKCYYADGHLRYLNLIEWVGGDRYLNVSGKREARDPDVTYQTKFTKQEIKDLIDEFGSDINDFEMVEVKE